jgi:hypothetical protein
VGKEHQGRAGEWEAGTKQDRPGHRRVRM